MSGTEHLLHVTLDDGAVSTRIECPNVALGKERPCAVWANDDGSETLDECTYEQFDELLDLEEWLHGRIDLPPIAIRSIGSGEDWCAEVVAAGPGRLEVAPTPTVSGVAASREPTTSLDRAIGPETFCEHCGLVIIFEAAGGVWIHESPEQPERPDACFTFEDAPYSATPAVS